MNDEVAMISPCGVLCADCPAHRAKDEPAMMKRMLELGFKEEVLPCPGCRSLKGRCPVIGGACDTYACFEKRGITFCYECAEFPCARFNPAADKSFFAVQNLKVFNLCRIQKWGVSQWLKDAPGIKKRYFQGKLIYGKGPELEPPPS